MCIRDRFIYLHLHIRGILEFLIGGRINSVSYTHLENSGTGGYFKKAGNGKGQSGHRPVGQCETVTAGSAGGTADQGTFYRDPGAGDRVAEGECGRGCREKAGTYDHRLSGVL